MVRLLIANKADVNIKGSEERTALLYAVQTGILQTAKLLVKAGADVNAKSEWRKSIMERVEGLEYGEIIEYVKSNCAHK